MKKIHSLACATALATLLTGCAGIAQSVAVGTNGEQVTQRLGTPTATYDLPSGKRLQYSSEPMGRQVYNIDLDATGRVASVTQMMQPAVLNRLSGVVLSGTDIRRELGAPAMVSRVGSFNGNVWSWRYEEMGIPRLFHAYIDPQGMVARTNSTDEAIRHSINM